VKLVLKGIWAIPVIASILILGSLGLIQDAHATTTIFATDTTITTDVTIGGGDLFQINPGVTLTIINAGVTITNFDTINNFGTINNAGTIINAGTINNNIIATIILVDGGSIINLFGVGTINNDIGAAIVGADQVSCGTGTTLNESTNECEADVTPAQLDAALAELVTLQGLLADALEDLGDALTELAAALLTITGLEALVEELGQPGPPIANQGEGKGVPAQGKNKP